jgi:hypothetical protein
VPKYLFIDGAQYTIPRFLTALYFDKIITAAESDSDRFLPTARGKHEY